MIGKLGLPELLVVLGIALLIFGPGKLSDLGKGLGEGIRNFKSAIGGTKEGESLPRRRRSSFPVIQRFCLFMAHAQRHPRR